MNEHSRILLNVPRRPFVNHLTARPLRKWRGTVRTIIDMEQGMVAPGPSANSKLESTILRKFGNRIKYADTMQVNIQKLLAHKQSIVTQSEAKEMHYFPVHQYVTEVSIHCQRYLDLVRLQHRLTNEWHEASSLSTSNRPIKCALDSCRFT